jgi:hypothetical protein
MSPTSYQTAPPRISIINNGFDIVKLAASRFGVASDALPSFNSTVMRLAGILNMTPSVEPKSSPALHRIQCDANGIEEEPRFSEFSGARISGLQGKYRA